MAKNFLQNIFGSEAKSSQINEINKFQNTLNSSPKFGANITKLDGTDGFVSPKTITRASNTMTPIPADSLNKETSNVNQVQNVVRENTMPVANAGFNASAMATSQENKPMPVATTPVVKEKTMKDQIQEALLGSLNKDNTAEKAQLRKDANVEEKGRISNQLLNQMRSIRVGYEEKKGELKNSNKEGRSMGSINNEINKLTEDTNRNLAYKSIEYDVANNDFISAEKTVTDRIQDMKDEDARQVSLYKTLYDFVQNDMTESEKMQAQQSFEEKQSEKSFIRQKELARYSSVLRREEDSLSFALKNAVTAQEAEDASKAILPVLKDKIGQISGLSASIGSANAVGPNALARFNLFNKFTGSKGDFVAGVEQLVSRETLDTLVNLKKAGGTLGALSEKELAMLNSSASRIGTWRQTDKNGNVVGYKTTEATFKKELDQLQMLTERAVLNAGGSLNSDPLGIGVQSDPLNLNL